MLVSLEISLEELQLVVIGHLKTCLDFNGLTSDIQQVIASENQPVRWTTPLGLPVLQPYFKTQRHVVSASLIK